MSSLKSMASSQNRKPIWCGEHGDGILRVPYAQKQWKEIWPLFEFVKKSFDPLGIFNPDKKVPVQKSIWPKIKF